jgi:hypothetical protein
MDTATDDLLTLEVMRAQYCDKQLPRRVKDRMEHLNDALKRILRGQPGPPAVPGLDVLLRNPSTGSQELAQMRRKFVAVFRELTQLIVDHCKVKALNVKLPDLSVNLTLKDEAGLGGCRDVPAALRRWFQDRDDATWRDKQVLCLAGSHGQVVNLPEGHLLPGNFVVVHNMGEGAWYGVARQRRDTWAQRLLELLKRKGRESLKVLVEMLWAVLQRATDAGLVRRAWTRLLVVVCMSILTKNTWALAAIPRGLLALCVRVLQAIGSLAKQAVAYLRMGKPVTTSQAVAVWFAGTIQAEVCPFVPQEQGLLPPPCRNCPAIAPPPPVPALPRTAPPPPAQPSPWLAGMTDLVQGALGWSAEEYVRMLVVGAVYAFSSVFDVAGWMALAGATESLDCFQAVADAAAAWA